MFFFSRAFLTAHDDKRNLSEPASWGQTPEATKKQQFAKWALLNAFYIAFFRKSRSPFRPKNIFAWVI